MAERATKNKIEMIKAERDGLEVADDIERFAREGWESIPEADRGVRLKWVGVFYRKQTPGYFMIRVRIPNGISNAAQLRAIGEITNRYGRAALDLTTRQQVQLRWIRIEDMPVVLERLREAGLATLQTGFDNIRGVAGCAVAGLTPNELVDASPARRRSTAASSATASSPTCRASSTWRSPAAPRTVPTLPARTSQWCPP